MFSHDMIKDIYDSQCILVFPSNRINKIFISTIIVKIICFILTFLIPCYHKTDKNIFELRYRQENNYKINGFFIMMVLIGIKFKQYINMFLSIFTLSFSAIIVDTMISILINNLMLIGGIVLNIILILFFNLEDSSIVGLIKRCFN